MPNPKPRVNADGSVSYRVQYRLDGKSTTASFSDPTGAQEFCDRIGQLGAAVAHEMREARLKKKPNMPTLREFTATYCDEESGLVTGITPGTRAGYISEAERSFLIRLGDMPVDLIEKKHVGAWVAWQEKQPVYRDRNKPKKEQRPVTAKTVKNYHALLSSIMVAAISEKHRTDNPAYKTRLSRGMKRENVFLSPSEFETLLHFTPQKHQRFVLFLAGTGLRWGEATAALWGDLALHATPPTVRVTKAWKKGKKSTPVLDIPKSSKARRSVSMFPDLVDILGTPGRSDALIFPNEAGNHLWHSHFTDRVWNKAVAKAMDRALCAEAGLTPLAARPVIHDLRHTHASWLIAAGVPLPYIQARMGHESITTTVNTYGHLVPDAHQQMATVLSDTLAGRTVGAIERTVLAELEAAPDDVVEAEVVEDAPMTRQEEIEALTRRLTALLATPDA